MLVLTALVGCAGGPPTEELGAASTPLDEAYDLLHTFALEIEEGLSYGAIRAEWPSISAQVRTRLDEAKAIEVSDWSEDISRAYSRYRNTLVQAHQGWQDVHEAVADHLTPGSDDGERKIGQTYLSVQGRMESVREAREEWSSLEAIAADG